jgi:3-deoxy-manno-octulosonate cytidylyltransferase (CMP-KDO synthetase)
MRVVAVIPARFGSTRFPGKPLAKIHDKPMIQWVYERASRARGVDLTVVATDDERISRAVAEFGGKVIMTASDIASGTDRVAAVADQEKADIYLNVQGDEPMIEPAGIERGLDLVRSGRFSMGTVMTPLKTRAELEERSIVKVLVDKTGRAIYFSRYPIPYSRIEAPVSGFAGFRHIGLYVYTRETLMRLRSLAVTEIERGESLEQLRALQDGIAIGCAEVDFVSIGVDTPEDLEKVKRELKPS